MAGHCICKCCGVPRFKDISWLDPRKPRTHRDLRGITKLLWGVASTVKRGKMSESGDTERNSVFESRKICRVMEIEERCEVRSMVTSSSLVSIEISSSEERSRLKYLFTSPKRILFCFYWKTVVISLHYPTRKQLKHYNSIQPEFTAAGDAVSKNEVTSKFYSVMHEVPAIAFRKRVINF